MNYTIVNRKTNFRSDYVQRVNENKVNVISIKKREHEDLLEVFSLLYERLRTYSDRIDFSRVVDNAMVIIRKRKQELVRVKRIDDMRQNAGFMLAYIIIFFGIMGLSFLAFIIAWNMLY